jgi:sugar (pentulose or hexulose) kinase
VTAAIVVLDLGKTHSKLSFWSGDGRLIAKRARANGTFSNQSTPFLDEKGIRTWLEESLTEMAQLGPIKSIMTIGHGAAAAIVRDGALVSPPMDYEGEIADELASSYRKLRDPFVQSGSPLLPQGLNLGAQLFALESQIPDALENAHVLLWPQYWAWVLSGVMASECSSLGCHTDLWNPIAGSPSGLATVRGWDKKLPPVRFAGASIGKLSEHWALLTGLSPNIDVYCGAHDSNAALVAASRFDPVRHSDATILSTGTWFVAMRKLGDDAAFEIGDLQSERDCLVNVDVNGRMVPSARFMGGREIEQLLDGEVNNLDCPTDQAALLSNVPLVVNSATMIMPSFAANVGPFPNTKGHWVNAPSCLSQRQTAIALYAALVSDVMLELINSQRTILIEGRFANCEVYVRALASLRPQAQIYVSRTAIDASFGALCLVQGDLKPPQELLSVLPLEIDLSSYRSQWRQSAKALEVQP